MAAVGLYLSKNSLIIPKKIRHMYLTFEQLIFQPMETGSSHNAFYDGYWFTKNIATAFTTATFKLSAWELLYLIFHGNTGRV